MNCISWIIGHLAAQEQRNWLTRFQQQTPLPHLEESFGYGRPASTPALDTVWRAWHTVVPVVDTYLDPLTADILQQPMLHDGQPRPCSVGTVLLRQIYHYWYHLEECMAIRQLVGPTDLPDFVGNLHGHAPYQPM